MAVKIRLRRMGKKFNPIYKIIVADSRAPRDGAFIAELGTYDPNQEPAQVCVNVEETQKWLGNGAQPTEVVARLFKNEGITK